MFTLITFILVLSVLVFVHELGHFYTARRFGIKAEEFGFGFPPRALGVYKSLSGKWKKVRGSREVDDAADTIYSLNWIPLGGFVKIKGENGESVEADSFAAKPIWQRAVVLSAGVSMNILLAVVLISIGLMVGMPQSLDNLHPSAAVSDRKIQVVEVLDPSPAKSAGVAVGDVIASINGQSFADYPAIQQFVDQHKGEELTYQLVRGQEAKEVKIRPELRAETGKGGIGVSLTESGIVKYPWYQAIWQGIKQTLILTWVILVAFYDLLKGLFSGQGVSADIAGPVGIASLTGQVARMGFTYLLQFTALLSINLAIINFLPFPALDGGRVLFLAIEKIKRQPVKRELEAVIHNIGFILLMALVLVVTFRDVLKFGGWFGRLWGGLTGWF